MQCCWDTAQYCTVRFFPSRSRIPVLAGNVQSCCYGQSTTAVLNEGGRGGRREKKVGEGLTLNLFKHTVSEQLFNHYKLPIICC